MKKRSKQSLSVANEIAIVREKGLGKKEQTFCDGLVTVVLDDSGGINVVEYHSSHIPTTHQYAGFFTNTSGRSSRLFDTPALNFRVRLKGNLIPQRLEQIFLYPFGFRDSFSTNGKPVGYSMFILGNQVLFEISSKARFDEAGMSIDRKALFGGRGHYRMIWDWKFSPGKHAVCFSHVHEHTETGKRSPRVYGWIESSDKMVFAESNESFSFVVSPATRTVFFSITFGEDLTKIEKQSKALLRKPLWRVSRQFLRYRRLGMQTPRLSFAGFSSFPDIFRLAPLYLDSMKIKPTPDTAIHRAQTRYYWIWSVWDNIFDAFFNLVTGQYRTARDIIVFHLKYGVGVYWDYHLRPFTIPYSLSKTMPPLSESGKGRLITVDALLTGLVARYYAYTKDKTFLKEVFPYLRRFFLKTYANSNALGFCYSGIVGPDYGTQAGRKDDDHSRCVGSGDMGIWYDALRGLENLAMALGDREIEEKSRDLSLRIERHFKRVFFDTEQGFLIDSIASPSAPEDKNKVFGIWSLLSLQGISGDLLLRGEEEKLVRFIETHLTHELGIKGIPKWTNLGKFGEVMKETWWQNEGVEIFRLLRKVKDSREIIRLLERYESVFKKNYVIPEDIFNQEVLRYPMDYLSYSAWQGMTLSIWYRSILEGGLGIEMDAGGLTYIPCAIPNKATLNNLRFGKSSWQIVISGEGDWVSKLAIDGKPLTGSFKTPMEFLDKGDHSLHIQRGPFPPASPTLLKVIGGGIRRLVARRKSLNVQIAGPGRSPVFFYSPTKPVLRVNKRETSFSWDEEKRTGYVEVRVYEKPADMEIHGSG